MLKGIKTLDEYYDYMYDIEDLTDLNVKTIKERDKDILKIEELARNNQCIKARELIDKKLDSDKDNLRAIMIKDALDSYSLIGSNFYLSKKDSIKDVSPKNHALRELAKYLKEDLETVKSLMKVEEPVKKDWYRFRPDVESEKSVSDFYRKTKSYIFELMAANNIIQTLYSYWVMLDKLKKFKIKTILDYGAGAGTLSILLKNAGHNVIYADLEGETFKFAKWRIQKRAVKIPMIDLLKKNIKELGFDCIVCTEVVEHLVKPLELIKKFASNLDKGQILVISESCKYTKRFSSHLESNKKYSGKKFIEIMKDLGFKQMLPKPIIPQLFFVRK